MTETNLSTVSAFVTATTQNISFINLENVGGMGKYYDNLHLIAVYIYYYTAIELVVVLPAILGNILILVSIVKFERLRTRLHILVANLAIADLLVGLVLIPFDLYVAFASKFFDTKMKCLGRYALHNAFLMASVMNLFLISLERYLAIIHPFTHLKRCTKRQLVVWIVCAWCLAIVTSCMPLWGVNTWEEGMVCDGEFIFPGWYRGFMHLLLVSSLITNFVMYIAVVHSALNQLGPIPTTDAAMSPEQRNKLAPSAKALRKTKIMIFILGVFSLCWGPYVFVVLLETFIIPRNKRVILAKKFLSRIGILNSGVNWFIYGVKNKDFKEAFKALIMLKYRSDGC